MVKTICKWSLLSSLVFVMACQTMQTSRTASITMDKPAETAALEVRLHQYFTARKTANHERLYEMSSPEFREAVTYVEFKESPLESLIGLSSIYILGIEFTDAMSADVWLVEYSRPTGIPTNLIALDQNYKWVKRDGVWYQDRKIPTPGDTMMQCGGVMREIGHNDTTGSCGN